jgi:hypothetical protein
MANALVNGTNYQVGGVKPSLVERYIQLNKAKR